MIDERSTREKKERDRDTLILLLTINNNRVQIDIYHIPILLTIILELPTRKILNALDKC